MTRRGDVVIVAFPFVDGRQAKNRPALVVQGDRGNGRLQNTIVAMITGNLRGIGDPTQLLVDPTTPDGQSSGLNQPSAVKCANLYTVVQRHILRTIGHLPPSLMAKVDDALKAALELS